MPLEPGAGLDLPDIDTLSRLGTAIPAAVRAPFERFFDADFSRVRMHDGPAAHEAAAAIQAHAFARGGNLFFARGRFAPETADGQKLIAHELAHTRQAPATRKGAGAATLLRQQEPGGGGTGVPPTLDILVRTSPPGFADPALDQAYQAYRRGNAAPSDARTWALQQTVGGPRARLEQLLGANYAQGQRAGTAAIAIDVRGAAAPPGYDPARVATDIAAVNADPSALTSRLQGMGQTALPEGLVGTGHLNILQGNVAEILARPVLNQALDEVRREAPDAQLFLGVRARIVRSDGTMSDPVMFTDGIIAAVRPGGLQIFRVAEIKSGEAGGSQGQEQIHRWIEGHGSQTVEVLLPGVGRTFRISDSVREVVGLARAPRMLIAPRGAQFTTERSGHGVAAPTQRIELQQSAAEINYITQVIAQQLLQVQQARRLLAEVQARRLTPGTIASVEELQRPSVVRRLLAENNGNALVRGQLYRVAIEGTSIRVRILPVSTIATPRLPAPAAAGTGAATPPALPQTAGGTRGAAPATGAVRQLPPVGGTTPPPPVGGPMQVPLPLPPSGPVPPNIINFTGADIVVGGRAVGPTPQVESLREGELVIVGFDRFWAVGDLRSRQPIAGVLEGGVWYQVVSGGRVLPLDAEGRIRTEVEPIPFAQLPAVAQTRPPAGPGAAAPGGPGAGPRVVAGGLAVIMLANEILGPIGQTLQIQRRNIEFGRAEINFWIQFGANPTFGVWSQNDRVPLGADAVPDTAIVGSPSFPYVADIDVNAFRAALPSLIGSHRDLLLFLDLAKTLGTIVEEPEMPRFPSPDERRQPRRYYALANKHSRGGRIVYDVTQVIAHIRDRTVGALDEQARTRVRELPPAEQRNIFRLRAGSATPLFRSARGGQPVMSDQQLLGDNPWVHPVGRRIEGGAWGWFRYAGGGNDRVLVEPANADALRAAVVSVYAIKSEIGDVLDEVRDGGRPIIQRQPPEGRLESFVAGPDPGGTRFGETRYYRMPEQPNNQTAAIGELKQFWVNGDDLERVAEIDVTAYANRPVAPAGPAPQ
jgi:hypothetical protein